MEKNIEVQEHQTVSDPELQASRPPFQTLEDFDDWFFSDRPLIL